MSHSFKIEIELKKTKDNNSGSQSGDSDVGRPSPPYESAADLPRR